MIARDVCVDMPKVAHAANTATPDLPNGNHDYTNTSVVIIGGGISGMCMAIELLTKRNIKNFIILEKSGGFGGTWRDNKFPGCCCDVWSVLYSYSFEQNPNWTRSYPSQEEILDYLTDVATKHKLYKYTRFNTTVDEARWDDATARWETKVSVGGGKDSEFSSSYSITSDFVVSGTGQLNVPKGLSVPGYSSYKGKIMHSARWDWSYPLDGKRIAMIGTGATTAQIAPEVAKVAPHLTICQRTPAWVIPRHDALIPNWKRKLFAHLPPVRRRARAEAMDVRESFHSAVTQAESPAADFMRNANAELLRTQLPHRSDLWDALTPDYSPGCKRTVISDDYYPCLARDNVTLETSPIDHFTEHGIQFADQATPQPFDLIVLATGFDTFSFMAPMKIHGRNGTPLQSRDPTSTKALWPANKPNTYKGATVPGLPNFGMLYGPNTNLSHNSLILVIEAQSRYLSALIAEVLTARVSGDVALSVEPREDVAARWNESVQARLQKTSFADPACNSWWKTADGSIPNNWAGTAVEYQAEMECVRWADFVVSGGGGDGGAGFKTERRRRELQAKVTRVGRVVEETRYSRGMMVAVGLGAVGLAAVAAMWA